MMYDYLGTYKPVFYLASASMVLGAIILLFVPCYIPESATSLQQVTNIIVTSPNGTYTRPPDIVVTVSPNESLRVVEKLTSL
jgi:hypothetical protein